MKKKVKVVGVKKEQMKASELDPNLFPRHQLVKAYESVGQEYEKTIQDRVYDVWYPLVTAEPVKDQEITQKITQLYRVKDAKGKEWLVYDTFRSDIAPTLMPLVDNNRIIALLRCSALSNNVLICSLVYGWSSVTFLNSGLKALIRLLFRVISFIA